MEFRLLHTEVPLIRFDKLELNEGSGAKEPNPEASYKLGLDVYPDAHNQNMFAVLFDMELVHHEEFKLHLKFVAWFETSEPLNEAEVRSPLARINAPAIAFPYLRSFVTLLTLNTGFRPAILPAINFIKMYEDLKVAEKQGNDGGSTLLK
jgi:preprotein translocase subunit SecB